MNGKTKMSMCIKDTADLLEMALRDHVFKGGEFYVEDISCDSSDMAFNITLSPKTVEIKS